MKLKSLRPIPLLIAGAVILVVCLVRLLSLPQFYPHLNPLQHWEWDLFDWRAKHGFERQQAAATNLAAVFLDDESLEVINKAYGFSWPLPRQIYGKLVRELKAQGAKAIAFDILFADRHAQSDATSVQVPRGGRVPSDEFFALQIQAASNVILAVMGESAKYVGWQALSPAPIFTNHARLSHIISDWDSDGVIRRVPAFRDDASTNQLGRCWHMGLVLAAMELNLDLNRAVIEPGRIILRNDQGVERIIPVDRDNAFYINWTLEWQDLRLRRVNVAELLAWDYERQAGEQNIQPHFTDMLVVVGSIGSGGNIADRGPTPLGKQTYLVSTHWNVANSVITGQFIRTCPLGWELAVIVLMGVLAMLLTWELRSWLGSVCVVGVGLIYSTIAYQLYVEHRFWLPIIMPVLCAMLVTHVCTITYRVVFEQREQRRIKGIFAKLVAADVVNELLEAKQLALGGAQRRVTVFFADVRGFTELTDQAQGRAEEYVRQHRLSGQAAQEYFDAQAQELLATVNLYLSTVATIIKQHKGTLDKYIGDCVMAFWGAPIANEKHALACVRAALATQRAIHQLNRERTAENQRREAENARRLADGEPALPLLSTLSLGSGINTGMVTVGLMGSDEHFVNYTVFGREVNLASRLEGISGRGRIMIGETTFEEIQRDDPALAATCVPQPPVMVKGFRKPVMIYEVPWRQDLPGTGQPANGAPKVTAAGE